jgi:arylsulfatase A-like enzyme
MAVCGAAASALVAADAAPETRKPNIVFILADDLGWRDTATYGSGYYETPNLDRLAAQGVRFTNHHHCQNCAPTRAALMSGQFGARTGVYTVGSTDRFDTTMRPLVPVPNVQQLPLDRAIIAKQLKLAGYATGIFGKWHLGENGDYAPDRRGFDEAVVGAGQHFNVTTRPPVEHPKGQYYADFLTDRAVDFIRRHKAEPFFLYLPHFAVHAPHQAKPDLIAKFKAKPAIGGHHDPTYAAMIASVDESIGRVMQTLDELGLAGDTVLIFASDNGGVGGYLREGLTQAGDITDNAPLRSGKGSLYEGGTRVPLVVRWPGVAKAGAVCDTPTLHVDMYPTFLEAASAARPAQVLDGLSLVPLLRDPSAALARTDIVQHFPGYLGSGYNAWRTTPVTTLQSGDWKLLEFLEDGRLELYNLHDDLGETKNLAAEQPEKAKELYSRLVAWRAEVKAPMPAKRGEAPAAPAEKKGKKKNKK